MNKDLLERARWFSWRRQRLDRTCRGVEDCLQSVIGVSSHNPSGPLSLLAAMAGEMKRRDMQEALGLKHEEHFREAYLLPALKLGGVEMTLPDKPRSSKQRYRITPRGKDLLKKLREDND